MVARFLHLIYAVSPHSSYITVFSHVSPSYIRDVKDIKNWKHEVTHDSCWQLVEVFDKVYFEMADEINKMRKADGKDHTAPINMSQSNNFRPLDLLFDTINVRVTKDKTDKNNYRRLVEIL